MRVLTSVLSFVFFSLLARKWGAEALGEFSTIFSIFLFLSQMPLLGLHIVIARKVAAFPETIRDQVTNALFLSLAVSIVLVFLVGILGQWLYSESMHAALWLVGLSAVFMAATSVAEAVLIGQEKMAIVAWANIAENVFRVCAGLIIIYLGFGLTPVVAAFVFARLIAIAIYLEKGKMREIFGMEFVSGDAIKGYLKQCPTFLGILFLSVVVGRFDFIVLSLMVSMKDVGMYSPPFKIYEIGLMVPSMITIVLFPVFSRFYQSAREKFDALYLNVFRFVVALGVPLVILLANSSSFLIDWIFGVEYSEASAVLQLLSLAILFVAVDQILISVTFAGHREDLEFKVLLIAGGVYLGLLFVMVSLLGYFGAAIATTAASFVKLVVRYIWIRKELKIPEAMTLFYRPAIAMIPLLLLLYFLKDINIFLLSFLALVVYFAVLFAVKGITKNQLTSFRQAMVRN
jgi:O-antigen/teichoic acid export membrane protein